MVWISWAVPCQPYICCVQWSRESFYYGPKWCGILEMITSSSRFVKMTGEYIPSYTSACLSNWYTKGLDRLHIFIERDLTALSCSPLPSLRDICGWFLQKPIYWLAKSYNTFVGHEHSCTLCMLLQIHLLSMLHDSFLMLRAMSFSIYLAISTAHIPLMEARP